MTDMRKSTDPVAVQEWLEDTTNFPQALEIFNGMRPHPALISADGTMFTIYGESMGDMTVYRAKLSLEFAMLYISQRVARLMRHRPSWDLEQCLYCEFESGFEIVGTWCYD